jgi:hypothetical protein
MKMGNISAAGNVRKITGKWLRLTKRARKPKMLSKVMEKE